nr:reverse transcriptase domain-containing protein [Tanacetum cinerariifolium]
MGNRAEQYEITFGSRQPIKGKIMEDFLVEVDTLATVTTGKKSTTNVKPITHDKETLTLHTDSASSKAGSLEGLVLRSPSGHDYMYALKFDFEASNNESEYKALLAGLREGGIHSKGRINEAILRTGESDPSILQLFLYHTDPKGNERPRQYSKQTLCAHFFEHLGNDIIAEAIKEKSILQPIEFS